MQLVSGTTFLVGAYLLVQWWRAHRRSDRPTARVMCLIGAAVGISHLLWELYWVKQAGAPPVKGSPEQRALMFRLAVLAFPANLLLLIGLFELSFKLSFKLSIKRDSGDRG